MLDGRFCEFGLAWYGTVNPIHNEMNIFYFISAIVWYFIIVLVP